MARAHRVRSLGGVHRVADPDRPVASSSGRAAVRRRVRITLLVATSMGFILNLLMFIAFDLVTVALALLCFYTYPAMVAVVNVVARP